jgi:hypothetical protein
MRLARRSALAALVLACLGGGALAACSNPSSPSAGGTGDMTTTTMAAGGGVSPGEPVHAPGGKSASGTTAGGAALSSSVGESLSPSAPLVVRTGAVTLGVGKAHIVQTFDLVSSAATTMGGFVASSSSNATDDRTGAQLVVRVPSSDFGALVTRVDALGKVEAQSENGQDVTGESIDIQASLANLQSEEGSLRNLLSRAGSIPAILQVQDQLFGVEGEIEQLTAQENSLVDQATYATLTVSLKPLAAAAAPKVKPKVANALVRALKLAGHNTAVGVRAVALAIGWAFPLLVIAALVALAWRLRRRLSRRQPPAPLVPPAV